MDMASFFLAKTSSRRSKKVSRRNLLITGAVAGVGGVLSLPAIAQRVDAAPAKDKQSDAKILNNALYYEHQAIWAYTFAASRLTNTDIGKAVLAVALANRADHEKHRDALAAAVSSLGGMPVKAESKYDLSSYLKAGEGGLDSDVNIAKLALALETDAAIAYTKEVAMLKTPALITAGASIGSNEAAHAATIRAAFKSLGVDLAIVPASFVSAETRNAWVLKV
jgi:rubrerythrin